MWGAPGHLEFKCEVPPGFSQVPPILGNLSETKIAKNKNIYTKVPDNELKMVTEQFVIRNSSLSVYNVNVNVSYRTGVR